MCVPRASGWWVQYLPTKRFIKITQNGVVARFSYLFNHLMIGVPNFDPYPNEFSFRLAHGFWHPKEDDKHSHNRFFVCSKQRMDVRISQCPKRETILSSRGLLNGQKKPRNWHVTEPTNFHLPGLTERLVFVGSHLTDGLSDLWMDCTCGLLRQIESSYRVRPLVHDSQVELQIG